MRRFIPAIALAIVSTSAFGYQNQDYTFKAVAQTGQVISGYTLTQFSDPAINNLQDVVFNGWVKAPIGSSTYFAGLFSPEALVVPTNGFVPSCFGPYAINDAGQIAFVEDSKLGPTEPNVSGIYESKYAGGTVQTIAAPGATVDGVQFLANVCSGTANAIGGTFSFNHAGRIAFSETGGFYKYTTDNGLKKITVNKIDGQPITSLALVNGDSHELLFEGGTAKFQAIFTRDRVLVKTPTKIGGVEVSSIFFPVASRDGKLVIEGNIGPDSANDFVLFTPDKIIAKSGQTIAGKVISTAGAPFFGSPAINNRGEVIFAALYGAGTFPNDLAIFSPDAVIVAVGDSIGGRTITALGQPALNDYGVIAFLATFSDGSQEIIEATPKWR